MKKGFLLLTILLITFCFQAMAQYKVLITNLNNKEEFTLNLKEEFYFGTFGSKEVIKGAIDGYETGGKAISINNKIYPINEIAWIDFKGHKPKKNTSKISRILLYFGASLIGFSVYEKYQANDEKTAMVTLTAGAACTAGALAFWILPRQPKFDFATKHLLELVQTEPTKTGTLD
jgi:hypothetical protein